jgi:hypothetical protein
MPKLGAVRESPLKPKKQIMDNGWVSVLVYRYTRRRMRAKDNGDAVRDVALFDSFAHLRRNIVQILPGSVYVILKQHGNPLTVN